MSGDNYDFIAEYCVDWVKWIKTRRFYINSYSTGSQLGRMQEEPGGSGKDMNGRNHPDMQYFNMAVHTCSDMPKYAEDWAAFKAYYLSDDNQRTVAKRIASNLGVCRRTYYNQIKRFAKAAYSMSLSLKKAHEAMSEVVGRPTAMAR